MKIILLKLSLLSKVGTALEAGNNISTVLDMKPEVREKMSVSCRGNCKNSIIDSHGVKGQNKTTKKKNIREWVNQTEGMEVVTPKPHTPCYPNLSSQLIVLQISIRLIGKGWGLEGITVKEKEYIVPPPQKPPEPCLSQT